MSQDVFSNEVVLKEIISEMHSSVVAGLVTAQLSGGRVSMKEIVDMSSPAFDKYDKKDILEAFIVFATNAVIQDMKNKGMGSGEPDTDTSIPMASGGDA